MKLWKNRVQNPLTDSENQRATNHNDTLKLLSDHMAVYEHCFFPNIHSHSHWDSNEGWMPGTDASMHCLTSWQTMCCVIAFSNKRQICDGSARGTTTKCSEESAGQGEISQAKEAGTASQPVKEFSFYQERNAACAKTCEDVHLSLDPSRLQSREITMH